MDNPPVKKHQFALTYFSHLTWCNYCNDFIWGVFAKQGYECEYCKFASHKKCLKNIPANCSGNAERIRDGMSRMKNSKDFEKARRELHAHFDKISDGEQLLAHYTAGHVGRSGIPKSGSLFITENYVAFRSTIGDTKKLVPIDQIVSIDRHSINSLYINTQDKKFHFMIFFYRDEVSDLLNYITLVVEQNHVSVAVSAKDLNSLRRALNKVKSRHRLTGVNESLEQSIQSEGGNKEPTLITAIRMGDLQVMAILLNESSIDVNATDRHGYTALHCAFSEVAADELVPLLLEREDIRLDIKNKDGNTALHYFCSAYPFPDCHKLGKMMFSKGADANARNNTGETPLHKAIFNSAVRLLMVQLLLENKADVNAQNQSGETALHYSVRLGREDLMRTLLIAGANPLVKGKDGKSLLQIAEQETPSLASTLAAVVHVFEATRESGLEPYVTRLVKEELTNPDVLSRINEAFLDKLDILHPGHRAKLLRLATRNGTSSPAARAKKLREQLTSMAHVSLNGEWLLNAKEVEFTEKLGAGASGKVFKGLFRQIEVAIKVLKNPEDGDLKEFRKEVQIMAAVKTPHTVKFYGAVLEPKICLVMELCSRGSLFHVLNRAIDFGWERFFSFAEQTVLGVQSLHNHDPQILHRDLKSLNLLVTDDWRLKICDYGLSRFNTKTNVNTLTRTRGTFVYMCPEVFEGKLFSTKSDIFAVGIILWELVHRAMEGYYARPYGEYKNLQYDFQVIVKVSKEQVRPTIPPNTPERLRNIITRCWSHDSDVRPTCEELLEQLSIVRKDYESNIDDWSSLCTPTRPNPDD